jgi:hypothetical protein
MGIKKLMAIGKGHGHFGHRFRWCWKNREEKKVELGKSYVNDKISTAGMQIAQNR